MQHAVLKNAVLKYAVLVLCLLVGAASLAAHVNDRGMDYQRYKDRFGQLCCGVQDCRPAADFVETVANGEPVIRLLFEGGWITVSRQYLVSELATDGRAHFCGRLYVVNADSGRVKPEPTCVILPPRGS
jgi:hypothetical protein